MSKEQLTPGKPAKVAEASDVEQETGHGGNLHDGATAPARAMPGFADVVGSSAHVPRRDEIIPSSADDETGSPGADADRGTNGI